MKKGYCTTEFWLVAAWTAFAAGATCEYIGRLASAGPFTWVLIAAAAPIGIAVWFAGVMCHNYGENRWRLKAHHIVENQKPQFGFAHYNQPEEAEEKKDNE